MVFPVTNLFDVPLAMVASPSVHVCQFVDYSLCSVAHCSAFIIEELGVDVDGITNYVYHHSKGRTPFVIALEEDPIRLFHFINYIMVLLLNFPDIVVI